MTNRRMAEATINATLDAHLHGAREGDAGEARQLHDMLDQMLTERELPEGRLWLTDHGKMLLAQQKTWLRPKSMERTARTRTTPHRQPLRPQV